jgi:DNA invertase Pin-like site-specific DNA recombinase
MPDQKIRCALYLRVSTDDQDEENQFAPLEKRTIDRGWELTSVYRESETAWKDGHQPELARLLKDAARHKFDILMVFALDRLTRQGSAAILNLVNTFAVYGVKVISFNEPWTETLGETGEILLAIAGWVARMESDRKSQNTRAGIAKARKNGGGRRGKDKTPRKRRWLKRPVNVTPSVFVSPSLVKKRL